MFSNLTIGTKVPALGKKAAFYNIIAIDAKACTLERGDTGSKVRVTTAKAARLLERLERGETVAFQGNASAGGVDGTSAIRDCLIFLVGAEKDGSFVRLTSSEAKGVA